MQRTTRALTYGSPFPALICCRFAVSCNHVNGGWLFPSLNKCFFTITRLLGLTILFIESNWNPFDLLHTYVNLMVINSPTRNKGAAYIVSAKAMVKRSLGWVIVAVSVGGGQWEWFGEQSGFKLRSFGRSHGTKFFWQCIFTQQSAYFHVSIILPSNVVIRVLCNSEYSPCSGISPSRARLLSTKPYKWQMPNDEWVWRLWHWSGGLQAKREVSLCCQNLERLLHQIDSSASSYQEYRPNNKFLCDLKGSDDVFLIVVSHPIIHETNNSLQQLYKFNF